MSIDEYLENRVAKYYWDDDINCATTIMKILSESFDIELNEQLIDAAVGMHGAGEYGAQCGLVEGTLMFIGISGREQGLPEKSIIKICKEYATQFEYNFGSLQCSILRPEGFNADNPPHICEPLTCKASKNSIEFIKNRFNKEKNV